MVKIRTLPVVEVSMGINIPTQEFYDLGTITSEEEEELENAPEVYRRDRYSEVAENFRIAVASVLLIPSERM